MKGVIGSVLLPEAHAALVHKSSNCKVVIWTPGREPQWRTRKATVAIDLTTLQLLLLCTRAA